LAAQDVQLRRSALDVELAPDLPLVAGDRVHLQQVVLNLILNGVDAMANSPPERRHLLLRTSRGDGHTVELEVRDAGCGIAPEAIDHLFEPFFTTKANGMGMGLSIVRSIVASHGGTIAAANNPSGGATFTVRLPALQPGEEEE
jgi:C4-dicarboxylate-specific signal transduction histidine kinase